MEEMNGFINLLYAIIMALIDFWPGVLQMILNFLEAIFGVFG